MYKYIYNKYKNKDLYIYIINVVIIALTISDFLAKPSQYFRMLNDKLG